MNLTDDYGSKVLLKTGHLKPVEEGHFKTELTAVLGASSYTYAEASWTQSIVNFLGSQIRAFSYFGGVPQMLVPDNLKSAVTKACRYDPDINRSYLHMAEHFGCSVMPARPYKPKDKAKAEVGVQLVERWILMRLRHTTFFSLSELNQAIKQLLEDLNNRPFKQQPGCRPQLIRAAGQTGIDCRCPYSHLSILSSR